MSVKETAVHLVNKLDANADWADVKNVIIKEYKKETGDSTAAMASAVETGYGKFFSRLLRESWTRTSQLT